MRTKYELCCCCRVYVSMHKSPNMLLCWFRKRISTPILRVSHLLLVLRTLSLKNCLGKKYWRISTFSRLMRGKIEMRQYFFAKLWSTRVSPTPLSHTYHLPQREVEEDRNIRLSPVSYYWWFVDVLRPSRLTTSAAMSINEFELCLLACVSCMLWDYGLDK